MSIITQGLLSKPSSGLKRHPRGGNINPHSVCIFSSFLTGREREVTLSLMSETSLQNEPVESKKGPGDSLIRIGTNITELSNQEVPNKEVIGRLAVIGAAGVCVAITASMGADVAAKVGDKISQLAELASNSGLHNEAANLFRLSMGANTLAIDGHSVSAITSYLIASEVAVIGGVEVKKEVEDFILSNGKKSLLNIEGTTKISTLGPKIGKLFITVGNHFNKKAT